MKQQILRLFVIICSMALPGAAMAEAEPGWGFMESNAEYAAYGSSLLAEPSLTVRGNVLHIQMHREVHWRCMTWRVSVWYFKVLKAMIKPWHLTLTRVATLSESVNWPARFHFHNRNWIWQFADALKQGICRRMKKQNLHVDVTLYLRCNFAFSFFFVSEDFGHKP